VSVPASADVAVIGIGTAGAVGLVIGCRLGIAFARDNRRTGPISPAEEPDQSTSCALLAHIRPDDGPATAAVRYAQRRRCRRPSN